MEICDKDIATLPTSELGLASNSGAGSVYQPGAHLLKIERSCTVMNRTYLHQCLVAHLVEHTTHNRAVVGSIPTLATIA